MLISPNPSLDTPSAVRGLVLPSRTEYAVTLQGGEVEGCLSRLTDVLRRHGAHPISLFVFGGKRNDPPDPGMSWLRGDSSVATAGLSSVHAFAVSGSAPAARLTRGDASGVVYEDDLARVCRLAGVVPVNREASREAQAREVFEIAESMLGEAGFRFSDTIRTWFYLERLLEWYGGFNTVRTEFFRERGVFDRLVPASTGIGAGNARGCALTADFLAIQPKDGRVTVSDVDSPLQDSAIKYRSSFSRAVEIRFPACRQLLVSGTASIDRDGRTVHAGNPAEQVALTMRVVGAILESRGMGWRDVTRGIAYFKRLGDRPLLDDYMRAHHLPAMSLAMAEADICRDDLDFEIEVDAVRS